MTGKSLWTGASDAVRLAVPLVLSQVAIVAQGFVDTLTFGHFGTEVLAGGALGNATFWLIHIFCIGTMSAVANLVAYAHGADDVSGIRRAMRAGYQVALALGVIAATLILLSPRALVAMGQKPADVAMAAIYLNAVVWSLFPSLVTISQRGLAIGLARPQVLAVITVAALALKALLNWLIVLYAARLPPEMQPAFGLRACGFASSLVNCCVALALFVWLRRFFSPYMAGLWRDRATRGGTGELLRLGLPMGITYGVESGLFSGAAFIVGLSGAVALAAHQIALQYASLAFMLAAGLAQSASARVGHEAGAGNLAEARRLGWQALMLGSIAISVPALVFITSGAMLAGWLVTQEAQSRADVVALAAALLLIAGLFQWADAAQTIAMSALRGLKQSRITMIVCTLGYWVIGLPLVYALNGPLGLGPQGAWVGLLLSLYFTAALLIREFDRYTRPKAVE